MIYGIQMMDVTYWLKCIHEWFPNLYNETYFLPPVHFNCVSYSIQNVAQVPILVPQLAAESVSQSYHSSSPSIFGPLPISLTTNYFFNMVIVYLRVISLRKNIYVQVFIQSSLASI